jgi:heme/copper-type cytochrome/quinol oxidase subunit 3
MSTIDERTSGTGSETVAVLSGPAAAPIVGFTVYLVAVILNLASDAAKPAEQGFTEWAVTLALPLAGLAFATWVAARAQRRGSQAQTALAMGIAGILTMVVFWAGFPCVFGATALSMGRAAGSRGAALAGVLLGTLALVAGAWTMVTG